ncbi:hypothetical protein ACRRS0_11980 [Agarivorans sp. QJM3NY_29]|uniref:hypothetical protein n=1 Tax=unclassified Agarivorans TaxID=2636026 RepID=UPI003D7D9805
MSIDKKKEIEKLKEQQQKENEARIKQQEKELQDRIEQLERQEEIEKTLKNILEEEDSALIGLTINALMPWIISNASEINDENSKELTKRLGKKSAQKSPSKSRPSYFLVDIVALKAEAEGFCTELLKDKDVVLLEEDNNYAVVYNKAYAGKIRNAAKALNTSAGDLYRKNSNAKKTLEVDHGLDLSKLKKSDFDSYTYSS